MQGVVGAIDGTLIHAWIPYDQQDHIEVVGKEHVFIML